jgi:predicted transcriptional regulator
MKKNETIDAYLRRRLGEFVGQHNKIAMETGVPQATVSRIHLDADSSPRLSTVQPLLDWFAAEDAKSARRVPNARRGAKAGGSKRSTARAIGQ